MRFCKKCTLTKSSSDFTKVTRKYKDKIYINYQSACKVCICSKWDEWKNKEGNLDKIRAKDRARNKCLIEWNPMKSPVPFHTLRAHKDTKYTRTDIAITKSTIHICDCGNRYLKTRSGQKECLRCIAYSMV